MAGRVGWLKSWQRPLSVNWLHLTPAGLPAGIPGMGEEMETSTQHAAQPTRQFKTSPILRFDSHGGEAFRHYRKALACSSEGGRHS